MFRLESYITPLVMNYIDRYVKLKPEDFQLSLWSGAAILKELDLRLDAIEAALNLPIQLTSGHISELKIQVPWTKLGFEPVVITISTMEVVLSLRDYADTRSEMESVSSVSTTTSSKKDLKRSKSKRKAQDAELPPGYVQSLVNRIVNNVNIVIENLILKFVEEDIVLSLNVKTLEIFSVNSEWKRAFADMSAPDFVLRRLIEFTDLTVCLDKRNISDGKINVYQDPLIYRCSLQTRIHTKFDNIHASMPSTTKIHTYCENLTISLSDTQLPMLLRIVEMMLAIYYGDIGPPIPADDSDVVSNRESLNDQQLAEGIPNQNSGESSADVQADGWISWAWSKVPAVLPSGEEVSDEEMDSREEPTPPIFDISFFNKKASLVFKLSKPAKTMPSVKAGTNGSKLLFEPLVELKTEGIALEIIVRGLLFLDVHFGISSAIVSSVGSCVCGVNDLDQQGTYILRAGETERSNTYLTGCLFDTSSHHGSITTYVFTHAEHDAKYKESSVTSRFGAVWINYLWIEEARPPDTVKFEAEEDYKPVFVDEVSYMKFWFNEVTLNYTSCMRHNLDKIIFCTNNHSYQPYAQPREEIVNADRPMPTAKQIEDFERFLPLKNLHLAFLRSCVNVYPSNHPTHDVSFDLKTSKASSSKKTPVEAVAPNCCLRVTAERFDMQTTRPMYPRKQIRLISKLTEPSGNLIYHCQFHQSMKAMRLEAFLLRDTSLNPSSLPLIIPVSVAYYRSYLLMSMYWEEHDLVKSTSLFEIPDLTIACTVPQLLTAYSIADSAINRSSRSRLNKTDLLKDAFNLSGKYPMIETSLNRFEWKSVLTKSVRSGYGNLGAAGITLISKDESERDIQCSIFQAPADMTLVGTKQLFKSSTQIQNVSDDFLSFTYQVPVYLDNEVGELSSVLLSMKGWGLNFDPMILKLILYDPRPPPPGMKPAYSSDVLIPSLVTSSMPQLQPDLTSAGSTTISIASASREKTKSSDQIPQKVDNSSQHQILSYVPYLFRLSKNTAINVKCSCGAIIMPLSSLADSDNCYNIAQHWRQMSYNDDLPDSLIVSLPSVTVQSNGVSLHPSFEDIPIKEYKGPIGMPLKLNMQKLSCYTHQQRSCNYLVKPINMTAAVNFTTRYHTGHVTGEENVSSLSLGLSVDVASIIINISKPQLELVVSLVNVWLRAVPALFKFLKKKQNKATHVGTTPVAEQPTEPPQSVIFDDGSSIHAVTENDYPSAQVPLSASSTDQSANSTTVNLKLEGKIPTVEFNVFMKSDGHKDNCLTAVGDDWSFALDIYEEYIKLQSKIGAVELLHGYHDNQLEEFIPGPRHGILLSSKQRMVNLHTMSPLNDEDTVSEADISQMMKEKPRNGFASFTFTRASSFSLKKRLYRLSTDLSAHSEKQPKSSTRDRDLAHITELCLDFTRSDVICYLPALADVIQICMLEEFPALDILLSSKSQSPSPYVEERTPGGSKYWFHSQTLPLIHFTLIETRFFFPVEQPTSLLSDTLVLSVQAIELTPQADNPLTRLIVNPELFRKNQNKMELPGSYVENRQLQMDIMGISLLAGCWADMQLEEKKTSLSASFENPAFEWNKISKAVDMKLAKLYPIVDGVQMNIQLAPAIVYNQILMCGHTVEVNAKSDINISITDTHLGLMKQLVDETCKAVSEMTTLLQEIGKSSQQQTDAQQPSKASKTGASMKPLAQYVESISPTDLLMTARGINIQVIGDNSLHPLISLNISQPHTVVCTLDGSEKFEISCYDFKVMTRNSTEGRKSELMLATPEDFTEVLIETKPGKPNPKTGIFPCLYTLTITNFLRSPNVNLVNGRPVRVILSLASLSQTIEKLGKVFPVQTVSGEPTKSTDKSRNTKSKADIGNIMMDIYEVFPLDSVRISGSQFVVSCMGDERRQLDFILQKTDGSASFTTSLDAQQMDCFLTLKYTDIQLLIKSSAHRSRLLGPASLDVDFNTALYRSHPPMTSCVVSSPILYLKLGNECFKLLTDTIEDLKQHIPKQNFKSTESSPVPPAADTEQVKSPTKDRIDYQDDLRMGNFKYLLDKDQEIARAGTVLFYSDRDYSSLTWSYPEPRVLKNIRINPIPFDYPADPNASFQNHDIQIECGLEFWDDSSRQFRVYSTFAISEHFGTTVSLPSIYSDTCIPARTWRIVINYYIERYGEHSFESVFAMVSPAVLVAAMRVDSCYIPYLVPTIQFGLSVDQIRVELYNQFKLSQGHHEKLLPFVMDKTENTEHEVFQLLLNKTNFDISAWDVKRQGPVKFELITSIIGKHIDYRHLLWKQFLDFADVTVEGDYFTEDNEKKLLLSCQALPSELIMGQGLIHSLLQLQHTWLKDDNSSHHHLLTALYTICNNTHTEIHFKQLDCDEASTVSLLPGQAHSYCWSKHAPLKLTAYLEEWGERWSSPFLIDQIGEQHLVCKPNSNEGIVNLIINVEKITGIHKMVTISGALAVCSRLEHTELEFRLSLTNGIQKIIKLSPGFPFSSFVVNTDKIVGLRVKDLKSTDGYSQEIKFDTQPVADTSTLSADGEENPPHLQLVKLSGEGYNEVDACCNITKRMLGDDITQHCVEITPMYSIRSYLPQDLFLNILPSTHVWLRGTGQTTELTGLNGAINYQISLQLSEQCRNMAAMLSITMKKLNHIQLSSYPSDLSAFGVCKQCVKPSQPEIWPPSDQIIILPGRFQSLQLNKPQYLETNTLHHIDTSLGNVGLEIEWSQRWPGTSSLLMTVRPKAIFVNKSSYDLTVLYGKKFCVVKKEEMVISPDGLEKNFALGVYAITRIYASDMMQVSMEEVSPRSYFQTDEALLYLESYTYANIYVTNMKESITQVVYLVVTSRFVDGVRLYTINDRFTVHSQMSRAVRISTVIAPISSERVTIEQVIKTPLLLSKSETRGFDHLTLTCDTINRPTSAALFISISYSDESGWSYPCQLPIEQADRRLTTCIPQSAKCFTSCLLTTHTVNGMTYIVISDQEMPTLVLHNHCSFPVAYGQTLTEKSEDVLEAMSLLAEPPKVKPQSSVSYSFPTVNKKFPEHVPAEQYPRLKLAGTGSHYGIEMWSEAIDVFSSAPVKLVHLSEVGGIKVTMETCQLSRHIHIQSVLKAEVAQREVKDKLGHISTATTNSHDVKHPETADVETIELTSQRSCDFPLILSADFLLKKLSIIVLDEEVEKSKAQEFLRLVLTGLLVRFISSPAQTRRITPISIQHLIIDLLDICLYNQLSNIDIYDFPVILYRSEKPVALNNKESLAEQIELVQAKSIISLELTFESTDGCPACLVAVNFSSHSIYIELESKLLNVLLTKLDSFATLPSILPRRQKNLLEKTIPLRVYSDHQAQAGALQLRELSIAQCELLISIHASLKVFLSTDKAPVKLPEFRRRTIHTTLSHLIVTELSRHYTRGALRSAAWVIGSLELIFNPTGIVRSFMTGMSDLVYLPYYGMQRGPGAFVTGVSQGMTSVVRNVTQGTLNSVTNFAQSVSRNMDRISLDNTEREMQERLRRNKPQALTQGIKQGFNGLALSFLGAVAGLADQPLQQLWAENLTAGARATGVVTGLGKGLIGVVAKPIGGTAEFISQTSYGLMRSIGLGVNVPDQCTSFHIETDSMYDYTTLKYRWRLPLLDISHGKVLATIRAIPRVGSTDDDLVALLLLPEVVVVIDCKEAIQHQAFALSEIDCVKMEETDKVYLQLILTGVDQQNIPPFDITPPFLQDSERSLRNRVEEYMDSTSGYHTLVDQYKSERSLLVLHEYVVPPLDTDHFIAMFSHTKSQLLKQGYRP